MVAFTIVKKDTKTKARTGILHTKSGDIPTPFFMPVATKNAVKHIASEDLTSMRARAIISNSFILSLRPGVSVIKKFGGMHQFMRYSGIIFTDSGGFQMYSPRLYIGSETRGVWFRDPYNGKKLFMTPEQNMQLQIDLNSDVAMCFDSMPLIEHSKAAVADAVLKTTSWAARCKKEHDWLQRKRTPSQRQLLFGIIQGGIHEDLRKKSAEALIQLDFDGYSIGGLALGETKEQEYEMIDVAKKYIPQTKPVYLMGAGNPVELLEAISRGVDMFDSRFPTKNARRGALFTSKGNLRIVNAPYTFDKRPIDAACDCFVCKHYSRAYIKHLLVMNEGSGMRLASYHNLYFLQQLMEQARAAIIAGTFKQFFTRFKKSYKI